MNESEQMIGIRELLQIFLRRRWWILIGAALGGAIGVFVALTGVPKYRAEVLLQPITRSPAPGGGIQALSGQLGGLASLVGLSLGESDEGKAFIATLTSRRLTNTFIEEENLMPVLFSDLWDNDANSWKTSDPEAVPTLWAAEQFFARKVRRVTESDTSGLIVMSVEWTDAELAAKWAGELVARANRMLQTEARDRAQRNIAFIEKQLQATTIVEVRQALNRLLEDQWKQLMLAQGDDEYAFRTIDPPVVPKGKINLPRRLVVLIWGAVGILLACIVAVAERVAWRVHRPGSPG